MSRKRRKREDGTGRLVGLLAAFALIGLSIAEFISAGHVDNVLVAALLAIVLAANGRHLDRTILRNLGDRLYEAGDDD